MRRTTIKVENISKAYRIYDSPKDRFREAVRKGKKSYGRDHYALRDISFEVKEGELLGIIGVNGSGKSTLLKIITGVLQPTEGQVTVHGRISALLELGAGFNPEYTGIENIYFSGLVMGFSRKEMDEKVQDIIAFADIGEYINHPVRTYSSGMLVRLAYSVAISIEPDILIVDEALAVGDVYFQMKSMSKMEELFHKGKTVLFVSHDTASVRKLCNTAIYLDQGEIIARGTAKEVVDLYEERARKVMSDTAGTVERDDVKCLASDMLEAESEDSFVRNENYEKLVAHAREGNGKARVCNLEFLSEERKPMPLVEGECRGIIRISILFHEKCRFSAGYHIRDEKNEPVLGSNTLFEGMGEISGLPGERIIVEFETQLPLKEGRYNIMTVLSTTLFLNRTVEFVDITKDGVYFDVLERKPYRIWNMVQIPNTVKIRKIKGREYNWKK